MKRIVRLACAWVILLTSSCARTTRPVSPTAATTPTSQPASRVATATHGMVVTAHPVATDAAVDVLRQGGNAVDAAVAAALMLGVVDGHNSGIGGGCFMLLLMSAATL